MKWEVKLYIGGSVFTESVHAVNRQDAEETALAPIVEKPVKKKREGKKMTDKQKADLNKHMVKVGKNMTATEKKSHRMKMMSKMRNQGITVNKAHKLISNQI